MSRPECLFRGWGSCSVLRALVLAVQGPGSIPSRPAYKEEGGKEIFRIRCVQNLRFTQPFVTYLSHSTQINTISFSEPYASVHSTLMDAFVKWARSRFNEVCYLAPSRSFPQGCPLLGSQKASSLLREAGAVSRTQPLIHFFSINLWFIWPLLTRIPLQRKHEC